MENKPILRIDKDGNKKWRLNGRLHQEYGPAIEYSNGAKEWWVNGKRHREDGPAFINDCGEHQWWINGQLHRLDGPAVIFDGHRKQWWVNNIDISVAITKWANHNDIDLDNLSEDDKNLIKLIWS